MTAVITSSGVVQLSMGRKPFGVLMPGLFESGWRFAALGPSSGTSTDAQHVREGVIRAPGGAAVALELRAEAIAAGTRLTYRLTPRSGVKLNSLHVSLDIPAADVAGTTYRMDAATGQFPAQFSETSIRTGRIRELQLSSRSGNGVSLRFPSTAPVLVQDNRQWSPSFSVRIGPQLDGTAEWPAGRSLELTVEIICSGGLTMEYDAPVTIAPGAEWLPLDAATDIEPGSPLDLSDLVPWHAPAGVRGRVVATPDGRLAFEKRPKEAVRFYGVNLCFSAQYITHEQADNLADRLRRIGYNAVRFHHYEGELVDRSGGSSTKLDAAKLDQIDYLLHALKKRGIYVTTDLYVSRPIYAAEVWPGEPGDVGMDEFKMAIPVNDRAFANYQQFASALLGHRNPYTGLRWADDPAVAWLSLINEGNPGNFVGGLTPRLKADYVRRWNEWLATRRTGGTSTGRADDLPQPGGPPGDVSSFGQFLADTQRAVYRRSERFLRDLGCTALLTNLNAWTNPIDLHVTRQDFGYVDDHFYVDHPEFIERPWNLPSRCPNSSPIAAGAPGGRAQAFLRVFGKPFTVSEYNYSGPGRYRGVGGIITGAIAAVQDWSVVWRFAFSHSRGSLFSPAPAGYFDIATDPLNLAAESASVCLFRRGDLEPARHSITIGIAPSQPQIPEIAPRSVVPGWTGLAWVTRVGTTIGAAKEAGDSLVLSAGAGDGDRLSAYGGDTEKRLLDTMRKRGWLPQANRTDPSGPVYETENTQLLIDGPKDTLVIDTERTAGGFAPAGQSIHTRATHVEVDGSDATVWVSSLDGAPISRSKRLLVTHLTDLQNSGARYGERARQTLLEWGRLPHLVRAGTARVSVALDAADKATVHGLAPGGRRAAPVACSAKDGRLDFRLSVDDGSGRARMQYVIEVRP